MRANVTDLRRMYVRDAAAAAYPVMRCPCMNGHEKAKRPLQCTYYCAVLALACYLDGKKGGGQLQGYIVYSGRSM